MPLSELAAYCAPVFWFSPDEPELRRKKGVDIDIPAAFPFEMQWGNPVVYYQFDELIQNENSRGKVLISDSIDSKIKYIDLKKLTAFKISYSHYYRFEAGLGKHKHDTEQAKFYFYVNQYYEKGLKHYEIIFLKAEALAHGLSWFDNIYELDTLKPDLEIQLPFHIFVEEGKHASCTDMNADGYYTPGYDVNIRKNDAWGVRDVIRTGDLFSPDFQAWMAKIRRPEYKVFPPLPEDSPLRKNFIEDGMYAPFNAIYELRPMPSPRKAKNDIALKKDMEAYYKTEAPEIIKPSTYNEVIEWLNVGNFIKSFSVAFRQNVEPGISISFPLLIVKNVEAPLVGGWLVNRIYFQGDDLKDYGFTILYTPSASRFLDPYVSAGVEFDFNEDRISTEATHQTDFVFETGIKIRANIMYSPFKFLKFLTEFWGIRLGVKNKGFMTINNLTYVFEIGTGVW